ncbi:amidohydrolase family protein [Actinoplanes sp. Pm04-4]|uniref:Amidohydrolase family protein n=1 Tax=Paractinoplanes pyxinae TaxID=2997416 RepID=A0ABT4B7P0_9ACTN|nr:amidohydrolase family protein [Actinoplanes pyxinae]MCY1141628.1 amidohydrolase family protein [Actinoplanes pyxinae]
MSHADRIDVHHHVVPPHYAAWLNDKGIRPGGVAVPDWSPKAALNLMDDTRVRAAILSVSTPGVWLGDAIEAERWAREVNEYGAQVAADHPGRFGFFATLTLPDVGTAIKTADHAFDHLDADGVVLLANNEGRYLGDPGFDPLLRYLNERRAVVFIHPGELPAEPVPGIPAFTADFLLDTTRTAISLIMSGALDRYPGIRFILAHAGGFVPYIADRILLTMLRDESKLSQARMLLNRERAREKRIDLIRRFYFDVALSSTRAALPSLLAVADPTHILYGSDYPFAPVPAVKYMAKEFESYPFDGDLRTLIDHGNARPLFPRFFTA